jgi:hypothetical protein
MGITSKAMSTKFLKIIIRTNHGHRNCHAVWRFAKFSNVYDRLFQQRQLRISDAYTAGNRHKQNSWFCKEIREDNFRESEMTPDYI